MRIRRGQVTGLVKPVGRLPIGTLVIVEAVAGPDVEITIPELEGIGFWRVPRDVIEAKSSQIGELKC